MKEFSLIFIESSDEFWQAFRVYRYELFPNYTTTGDVAGMYIMGGEL